MRGLVVAAVSIAFLACLAACASILGVDKDYEDIGGNGSGDAAGSEVGAEATTGDGGGGDDGATNPDADGGIVAPDAALIAPGDVRFVYAESNGDVSYRVWSHAAKSWSAATKIAQYTNFDVPYVVPAIGPSNAAEAIGTMASGIDGGTGGTVRGLSGLANWAPLVTQQNVISAARVAHRGFDIAFSTMSGDGMVVYSDGSANPKFRASKNGVITDEAPVLTTAPGLGAVDWVELVSSPKSDEITLLYTDTSQRLYGAVWSGTAWTATATTLENGTVDIADFVSFAAAYENLSGDLLVLWSAVSSCNGPNDNVYYATKANGTTTFSGRQTAAEKLAGFGGVVAASEPGTDRIAFSTIEYAACCKDSGCNDEGVAMWDGNQFATNSLKDLDGTTGILYAYRPGSLPVAAGWVGKTGKAVAIYAQLDFPGKLSWATWTSAGGWALETAATLTPAPAEQASYAMVSIPPIASNPFPNDGALVLVILDINGNAYAKLYDGASWVDMNNEQPLATNIRSNLGVPFGLVTR